MRYIMTEIKQGTICPLCEKGKLVLINKELSFSYKQRLKRFPHEKVYICDLCKFEVLSELDNHRIEKILTDFRRNIDGLLSCDSLKKIREGLVLTKGQMATLLSVNEKTIGRYESGKVTQSEHMDKLYRILRDYPFAARAIDPGILPKGYMSIDTSMDSYQPRLENRYFFSEADDYLNLEVPAYAEGC